MKTYFYIRASAKTQKTIRQEVKAEEHGIPRENVYIELESGKSITNRPVLRNLMSALRTGDKVIVDSISRFARNTKDLIELVEELNNRGIIFVSLAESVDTTTPTGMFMVTLFGSVAQLERDYIRERQSEGIAIAKANGVYKGRKTVEYPPMWDKYYKMVKSGDLSNVDAMKILDLKHSTYYRLMREYSI